MALVSVGQRNYRMEMDRGLVTDEFVDRRRRVTRLKLVLVGHKIFGRPKQNALTMAGGRFKGDGRVGPSNSSSSPIHLGQADLKRN